MTDRSGKDPTLAPPDRQELNSRRNKDNEAPFNLARAVAEIEERLKNTDETTAWPALIMISGLPATGKSYLARRLAKRLPFVVIETDFVRKCLFSPPTYSAQESTQVFKVCHALINKLLRRGVRVIFDATNLIEFHREKVYRLALRREAKLIIVRTVASEEVVRERLHQRETQRDPEDISDANWRIYRRMAQREEPIGRPHLIIDTSDDIEAAVRKILRIMRKI